MPILRFSSHNPGTRIAPRIKEIQSFSGFCEKRKMTKRTEPERRKIPGIRLFVRRLGGLLGKIEGAAAAKRGRPEAGEVPGLWHW
jgi:hypothetical protein